MSGGYVILYIIGAIAGMGISFGLVNCILDCIENAQRKKREEGSQPTFPGEDGDQKELKNETSVVIDVQ